DSLAPRSRAVVRNTRSPQMTGDEFPDPGTGAFQTTLVVGDHVSTYPESAASPCPDGPRQRGQYFAPSPSTATMRTPESCATAPGRSVAAANRLKASTR